MIYLLHSTVPVGGTGTHSARHYMGYTPDQGWRKRIDAHRAGKSRVKIVDAFVAQGGRLLLVAVLPGGTRTDERALKYMGHMARLCPICSGKVALGWPNGLISLIPRRRRSDKPSAEHSKVDSTGKSSSTERTATSIAGESLASPHQGPSTTCG